MENDKMIKVLKFSELMWLAIGTIGIVSCAYSIVMKDTDQAVFFLIFTLVAGISYSMRRYKRKKLMKENEKQGRKNK